MKPHPFPLRRSGLLALFFLLLCAFPALSEARDDPSPTPTPTPTPPASATAENSPVVRTSQGDITRRELDRFLLALPVDQRDALLTDGQPGRDALEALVVSGALLDRAYREGLDRTPSFQARERLARLSIAAAGCLRTLSGDAESPDVDTLLAEYQRRQDEFRLPERREVYHLFLAGNTAAVEQRLLSLRQQVLDGENFPNLARQHSESETRHRRGKLAPGLVTRETLPTELAELVFALPERTPSQPFMTSHGGHLFWVGIALPAQAMSFETVRPRLLEQWRARQTLALYRKLEIPESLWRPDRAIGAGVARGVETGDSDIVLATLQDGPLTLAELQAGIRSGNVETQGNPRSLSLLQSLQKVRLEDALYAACDKRELVDDAKVDGELEVWRNTHLEALQREQAMMAIAAEDPGALRDFHASNSGYFSDSPRWALHRLSLPIDDNAVALFQRLDFATGSEPPGLPDLAEAHGGQLQLLPPMSARELSAIWPELPERVSGYRAGERLPPIRTGDTISVFQVESFHPPQSAAFDEVERAVTRLYARQHAGQLYAVLRQRLLEQLDFTPLTGIGASSADDEP